jgi:hypothetical protein
VVLIHPRGGFSAAVGEHVDRVLKADTFADPVGNLVRMHADLVMQVNHRLHDDLVMPE